MKTGVSFPLFEPPFGLEAGYLGYAKTLRFDTNTLFSDLIQLAAQGQIVISPATEYIEIERAVEEWSPKVSPAHLTLLLALFPGGSKGVRLGGKTGLSILSAPKLIRRMPEFYGLSTVNGAVSSGRPRLVDWNVRLSLAGLLFFIPLLWIMSLMDSPLSSERGTLYFWYTVVLFPIPPLLFSFIVFYDRLRRSRNRLTAVAVGLGYFMLLVFIYVFNGMLYPGSMLARDIESLNHYYKYDAFLLIGLWVAILGALFFSCLMPQRTKAGRMLLDRIEGFEMYLKTAEKNRIEMLYPTFKDAAPDMTIELFERFLPYAFALGVVDAWMEAFTPLLEVNDYRPRWYRGWAGPRSFGRENLTTISHAMNPPTSSGGGGGSGRSGGGSSGGGRGGGGGRGR